MGEIDADWFLTHIIFFYEETFELNGNYNCHNCIFLSHWMLVPSSLKTVDLLVCFTLF